MKRLLAISMVMGLLLPSMAQAAATDARALPLKATAYRVTFPIFDADGDPVTGATGLDSEVDKDAAGFNDAGDEAHEIGTTGIYYLDLTNTEMSADTVTVQVKTSTAGAKTTVLVMYPLEAGDLGGQNVAQWDGTAVHSPGTAGIPVVDLHGVTFPTNFSSLAITTPGGAVTVGTNNDKTGYTASTVSDKTGYSLTASIPSAADNADAVWDEVLSGHAGVGAAGTALTAAAAVTAPSAATITDAVWDEATSGHAIPGSTGAALSSSATATDPWTTALPGSYVAGSAGHILAETARESTLQSQVTAGTVLNPVPTVAGNALTVYQRTLVNDIAFSVGTSWASVLGAGYVVTFTAKQAADSATAAISKTMTVENAGTGALTLDLTVDDTDVSVYSRYTYQITSTKTVAGVVTEQYVLMTGLLDVRGIYR